MRKIQSIAEASPNSLIDVIGIVENANPPKVWTSNGKTGIMQTAILVDDTGKIPIVLWGKENVFTTPTSANGSLIHCKKARVNVEAEQKKLSMNQHIVKNPTIPQGEKLKQWYAHTYHEKNTATESMPNSARCFVFLASFFVNVIKSNCVLPA